MLHGLYDQQRDATPSFYNSEYHRFPLASRPCLPLKLLLRDIPRKATGYQWMRHAERAPRIIFGDLACGPIQVFPHITLSEINVNLRWRITIHAPKIKRNAEKMCIVGGLGSSGLSYLSWRLNITGIMDTKTVRTANTAATLELSSAVSSWFFSHANESTILR